MEPTIKFKIRSVEVGKRPLNLACTQDRANRKFMAISSMIRQIYSHLQFSPIYISMLRFRYGISYHGAAQAASGTKEQVTQYREKSKKLFQSIGQFSRSNRDAVTMSPLSDIANINDIGAKAKPSCKQKILCSLHSFPYFHEDFLFNSSYRSRCDWR